MVSPANAGVAVPKRPTLNSRRGSASPGKAASSLPSCWAGRSASSAGRQFRRPLPAPMNEPDSPRLPVTERKGQRRESAAGDVRSVPERIAWLPFAEPSGWALDARTTTKFLPEIHNPLHT